jgi:XTP/dITP diphosphohydrolase
MTRRFQLTQLLIASKNEGKVQEIRELLADFNIQVVSAVDFTDIVEPEETGKSFKENAELKARYYSQHTNLPALADDSGLCVDALKGAPGIYSARWAAGGKDFGLAINRIKDEVKASGAANNNAEFVCALALCWPDGHMESFEGYVKGALTFPPKGEKGFGYDPIFIPRGYNKTFAEISSEDKHRISHRADAFNKLIQACFK